jgi:hypothetical protein
MSSVCDYCQSGFTCGRLYTALRIVEANPEYLTDVRFARTYAALKARLAAEGWDYPDGRKACELAGHDGEISRLTEQLIAGLQKRADGPRESFP